MMNANELAEIIEHLENARYMGASKAATMLRQQQAEIEALKQIIDANNLNQNIGQFVKPTNEPVAWIKQNPETLEAELHFDKPAKYWSTVVSNPDIPLYTHPVKKLTETSYETVFDGEKYTTKLLEPKVKELTDEEILNLWWDSDHTKDEDDLILTFVKRILKER